MAVVREMCVKCLAVVHNTCEKSSTPYLPVIKKIVRCGEEIEADPAFILQVRKPSVILVQGYIFSEKMVRIKKHLLIAFQMIFSDESTEYN